MFSASQLNTQKGTDANIIEPTSTDVIFGKGFGRKSLANLQLHMLCIRNADKYKALETNDEKRKLAAILLSKVRLSTPNSQFYELKDNKWQVIHSDQVITSRIMRRLRSLKESKESLNKRIGIVKDHLKGKKSTLNRLSTSTSLENAKAEAVSTPLEVKTTGKAREKFSSAECHPLDLQSSSTFVPEKRVSRQRKPVILMQNQYEEIYATRNKRIQVKKRETTTSSTLSSRRGMQNESPLNRYGDGSTNVEIVSSTTCKRRPLLTKQGNGKKINLSNASNPIVPKTDPVVKLDPPVLISGTKRCIGEVVLLSDMNRLIGSKRTCEDEPISVMITEPSSTLESHKEYNIKAITSSEAFVPQQNHAENVNEKSVKINDSLSSSYADGSDDDDSTDGESWCELEKRRSEAREFLIMAHSTLGRDKYNSLVMHLKEYQANAIDASHLKVTVSKLFDDQPDLMKGFMTFLPKQLRK